LRLPRPSPCPFDLGCRPKLWSVAAIRKSRPDQRPFYLANGQLNRAGRQNLELIVGAPLHLIPGERTFLTKIR
jgi:hypothetical protein